MVGKHRGEFMSSFGFGPFLGRLLLSLIFILAGIGKIFDFSGTVQYLQSLGMPMAAVFAALAMIFEIVGGILILLGWYTRLGVIILMIFLLPTTLLSHNFWDYSGFEMKMQMANFMKNIAIYGGLVLLFSYGPGRWSIDAKEMKK